MATPSVSVATPAAAAPTASLPYTIERFTLPGPMVGVAAKIDMTDPRIAVEVALADDRDPDGDGPCAGQLETVTGAARKHDLAVTMNASFFAAPIEREVRGKKLRYVVGNCTTPMGWHVAQGKTISKPANERLRASVVVATDGSVRLIENLVSVPENTRFAVSGNAMVLRDGKIVATDAQGARHPRSVVGVSEDRKTLWLVAVDGRQEGHSRGASMLELGELMKRFGAWDAVNLDGGGSTAMVVKDHRTGTFGLANQPSETSTEGHPVRMERPVADVIGIRLRAEPEATPRAVNAK
jgi:hypothetical protein